MRINHNIAALNTYRQLTTNNANGAKSLEKLSSGYRINRAGDDAAGLAISEKMRAQIRGLGMASKNSQDAISLIQTAEGALSETHSILQRMRELGVQAANDTNVTIDRGQIQKEMDQLTSEINRIGGTTEFNTMKLLNGERAIVSTTVGTSGAATLNSGSVTLAYAAGVTGDADLKNAVSSISITATGVGTLAQASGAGNTTNITLTYNSSNATFTVSLKATAGGSMSATDTLEVNASGNYVYNDHGVSFTINGSDLATAGGTISGGETLTLKVSVAITAGTSYSTINNWDDNNSGVVTVTSGITITATEDNKNVRAISIQATTGGVTVTLYDQFSAGRTAIDTDLIGTGQGTFAYDAHGISFSIVSTGITAAYTASALISLTSLGTTKAVTNVTTVDDKSLKFQVGANENQSLGLDISDMRAKALGISTTASGTAGFNTTKSASDGTSSTAVEFTLDVSSSTAAAASVTVLNTAISSVSDERAKLGAVQNRLEHTINNLDTASENLQASESRIRDVDMAKEMMEFTKNNILMQAAQSMLAQANQQPQGVLQLLR